MAEGEGPWWFSESHLNHAVDIWRRRESPSDAQVSAFYDWCFSVSETGPPTADTAPIPGDHDGFVSRISNAGVFVTYLAVAQDCGVFVRSIDASQ